MRDHDVRELTASELGRAKRDLRVSLALSMPGSPVAVPITARLEAIEAEMAGRIANQDVTVCSCGFATDDREWLVGHLWEHPGHQERPAVGLPAGSGSMPGLPGRAGRMGRE